MRLRPKQQLPPWEYPGLPEGLTEQAFSDAGEALRTGSHSGRVQALPDLQQHRTARLYGTDKPHNKKRIMAAKRYPALADAVALEPSHKMGHALPAILWSDPSPTNDDVVPLAVILPNGYAGSVWNATGTVLANWVVSHQKQGWLWATIAFLPSKGTDVDVLIPQWKALGQC